MKSTPSPFAAMLRESGYKATPSRLSLLQILAKADAPISIPDIIKESQERLTQATLYRALDSLTEVGIVRRIDVGHAHAHYELEVCEKHHHHHLICKMCGKIEDVELCEVRDISTATLKHSKEFSTIQGHSLEFFGVCKKCAKKIRTNTSG